LELMNQLPLVFNVVIMVLLIHVDGCSVLFHDLLLGSRKSILVSLLLLLEFIKSGSILKHFLVVLIASGFELLVLLLLQKFKLLLVLVLHVLLRGLQLVVVVTLGDLVVGEFFLEHADLIILVARSKLVINARRSRVSCSLQLILCGLFGGVVLFHFLFLSQDFIRKLEHVTEVALQ